MFLFPTIISAVPAARILARNRPLPYSWLMTVELSKEAEESLSTYLSEEGLGRDAAPGVIEEALEAFLFRQTLQRGHALNEDLSIEDAEALAEKAVRAVRRELRG